MLPIDEAAIAAAPVTLHDPTADMAVSDIGAAPATPPAGTVPAFARTAAEWRELPADLAETVSLATTAVWGAAELHRRGVASGYVQTKLDEWRRGQPHGIAAPESLKFARRELERDVRAGAAEARRQADRCLGEAEAAVATAISKAERPLVLRPDTSASAHATIAARVESFVARAASAGEIERYWHALERAEDGAALRVLEGLLDAGLTPKPTDPDDAEAFQRLRGKALMLKAARTPAAILKAREHLAEVRRQWDYWLGIEPS